MLRQLLLFISAAFVAERSDWDAGEQITVGSFSFARWAHISDGVYWAVTLALMTLVLAVLNHFSWWIAVQLALTVRGGCIGLLYHKSSRMHWSRRAEYSSGRICNGEGVQRSGNGSDVDRVTVAVQQQSGDEGR